MVKYISFLLLFVGLMTHSVFAVDTLNVQTTTKTTVAGSWITFSERGLHESISKRNSLYVDQSGNVWWAIPDGVVCFDGLNWVKYTAVDGLMDGQINSIVQADDGTLYFSGSHKGQSAVTQYDGKTWKIYSVADGLKGESVGSASIIDTNGNLWVNVQIGSNPTFFEASNPERGGHGVFRFDGTSWQQFTFEDGLLHNRVYAMATGLDGSIWFATIVGVCRFDGEKWMTYPPVEQKLYDIFVAQDGKIWCLLESGGVAIFNGKSWTWVKDAMPAEYMRQIHQSRDGAIWLGTIREDVTRRNSSGLLRYQGGTYLRILPEDGLPGEAVPSIASGLDGSLWLGVDRVGLVQYRPNLIEAPLLQGQLSHPFDGTPYVGHGVRIEDLLGRVRATAQTDSDGRYRVRLLPGEYRISASYAQGVEPVTLSVREGEDVPEINFAPAIIRKPVAFHLTNKWQYRAGDNIEWAKPTLDDKDWEWADTSLRRSIVPKSGWPGVGWFRLWVSVDSTLVNTPIALHMSQRGASEVYLNGKIQYAFGRVGTSRADEKGYSPYRPQSILFDRAGDHLIAVRYSNFASDDFFDEQMWAGFSLRLGDLNEEINKSGEEVELKLKYLFWFVGVPLLFGGLHLLFFLFYPRAKENLYYALFVFCFATIGINDLTTSFDGFIWIANPRLIPFVKWFAHIIGPLIFVAALRFLYALFYQRLPKQFWIFLALYLVLVGKALLFSVNMSSSWHAPLYIFASFAEIFRVTCLAIFRKRDGAWIIWTGFLAIIINFICMILVGNDLMLPFHFASGMIVIPSSIMYPVSTLWLIASVSVYLARNFAKTNLSLEQQLIQVQELSEKTLEQERRIQQEEAATREAQLRSELAEEQTKQKSIFLASMSHELRTPLNAIKGFTSLVLRRIGDSIPTQQKENLEKVGQASDHLLAMINDLLDLSKIEAGRMEVNAESFDVNALIKSCCATVSPLLEERPNVALNYSVADGVGQVNTDQGRIRQMMINLLSNAIKFTDAGNITLKAEQENDQLLLSVSDTGKGIPDDEVATIFDEYRQVKGSDKEHKGTGLGLSITKQFAELLGGTIGVESEVGKGSTFTVRVPVVYET